MYLVDVIKLTHDGARPVGLPERTALHLGQPTKEFHWQSTKVEDFFYDNVLACIHSAMRCVHNSLSYIARDQAVISGVS